MASKSSYLKSKTKSRGEDIELVPVRSNVLYGIQTQKYDEQKSSTQRRIRITPTITFYDNYTKALIDFSDYLNNPQYSDIKSFFDLLINGLNFTITDAVWNNPTIDKLQFNLNGTYKFLKIIDDIVFAEVVSIESYSNNITRYDKSFFSKIPVVKLATIISPEKKEIKSYIFNHLGKNSKNSFSYMGLYPGDYLQIQNQQTKYKVLSYDIDIEGKEVVVVSGELPNQNQIGTPILFTLHVQNIDKIQLNYDNNSIGKAEFVKENIIAYCLSNQTELQAKLRENKVEGISSTFTKDGFCDVSISKLSTENENLVKSIKSLQEQVKRLRTPIQRPLVSGTDMLRVGEDLYNNLFN